MTNWKCCEKEPPSGDKKLHYVIVREKGETDTVKLLYSGDYLLNHTGITFKIPEGNLHRYQWRYADE